MNALSLSVSSPRNTKGSRLAIALILPPPDSDLSACGTPIGSDARRCVASGTGEVVGAADRICDKRLRVLVPVLIEAMERHGHLQLDPVVRSGLLDISAATIDMPR